MKKRILSIVLTLCMVLMLVPATAFAEENAGTDTGTEPSVTAYATKEQLMNSTFAPDSQGKATNIGKLIFGKKSDGTTSQEWYILGQDENVEGDNTTIFASDSIATGQKFEGSTNGKGFAEGYGTYESNSTPANVYANHYGASSLRALLKEMAASTSYFTSAQQSMMNNTTAKTKDNQTGNTYTTTDKLYALQGGSSKTILAGTNDDKVLAYETYWSSGDSFWLRTPTIYTTDGWDINAGAALPASKRYGWGNVTSSYAVRPASNLNLSSVLFASAATAASSSTVMSGNITSGMAMTLRLDGSSKNIGTITYNTTSGDIKATKRSTTGDVALVVQGNDGTDDWYFSKKITGTETVNVSDMKSSLGISADIDLSKCKIWLETTDNGMIYAVAVNKCSTEDELRKATRGAGVASIMLTDDITLSGTLSLDKEITILDLNGHVIKMTGNGSVIRVNSNCSLTLQDSRPDAKHTGANDSLPVGGVITGGKATGEGGGGVLICRNGTFTMNGGTISNCGATNNGGGVLNAGSFTMNGGTISNCSAANGDGVFNKGSFTMNGGSIVNYTASSNAGVGVYNENGATEMRANGGEITGLRNDAFQLSIEKDEGKSGTTFYGDVVNTLSTINAGTYKGTVTNYKGSSDMVPGTISGGIFEGTVINRDEGVISGGIYYGGIQNDDSSTVTDTYYKVSFDLGGGEGSVPTQWFVNVSDAQVRQPADPERDGYVFLGWYNGDDQYDFTQPVTRDITLTAKLVLLHQHCLCGGEITASTHTNHDSVTYQAWDGSLENRSPKGIAYTDGEAYVFLKNDAELTDCIEVVGNKTLVLCLNGKKLERKNIEGGTSDQKKFIVKDGARLVICDCQGGGSIICGPSAGKGGAFYIDNGATMDFFGGKITNSSAEYGGAIAVTDLTPSAGVFNPSTLNIYGGEISGNTATKDGGAVYVHKKCTLNIYGRPVVKNNTVGGKANNIYLPLEQKLSVENMTSGASIGITTESKAYPAVFTDAYNEDYSEYFQADLDGLHVSYNDAKELVLAGNQYEVKLDTNGGTINQGNVTGYTYGVGAILPTADEITYEGHTFGGWYDNKDFAGDPVTTISSIDFGNKTFYAKWNHTSQTTITKATTSADGKIVESCSVCNKTLSTTVIPKVSGIKLSATSYTYDGKTKTPKLNVIDAKGNVIPSGDYTVSYANGRKNVGSYKVTVTFKSTSDKYSGLKDTYFNINPKGTSIASVAGSSKAFTVKWKKQSTKMATSTITGYQIRYSTSSKMTGAKTKTVKGYKYTSKKITKLKAKKKYYVQVRTYKTVSRKIYYSSWSKVKSVKTK